MPYNFWWEVERQVLYLSFTGNMTSDELLKGMQEVIEEMKLNGGPFVNVITDVRNIQRQLPLTEVMKIVRQFERPEQMGWSITVGDTNPIMRFTANIAGQLMGQRMRRFDTPEEAMAFLREFDPSIEWDTGGDV